MTQSNAGTGEQRARVPARWGWVSLALVSLVACQAPTPRVFQSLTRTDSRPTMTIVLINYLIENPPDFSAIYYSFSDGPCTSSLVGTKVLLTAGHCVPEGGGNVTLQTSFGPIMGTCKRSRAVDLALCALNDEPSGAIHETINSDGSLLHDQQVLLLSGFGCTKPHGANTYDPEFRIGLASIAGLPAGQSTAIKTSGGAVTCEGDSGAPGFAIDDTAAANPLLPGAFTRRMIVGVSVLGDEETSSTLVSTSARAVQNFFQDWTYNSGLKICGFNREAESCRAPPGK